MSSQAFWMQVRRALITLAHAVAKYEENTALLSALAVGDDPPVAVDLQKVYNIGDVAFAMRLVTDESDTSPSSSEMEVQSCTLVVKIRRFQPK